MQNEWENWPEWGTTKHSTSWEAWPEWNQSTKQSTSEPVQQLFMTSNNSNTFVTEDATFRPVEERPMAAFPPMPALPSDVVQDYLNPLNEGRPLHSGSECILSVGSVTEGTQIQPSEEGPPPVDTVPTLNVPEATRLDIRFYSVRHKFKEKYEVVV